MTVRRELKCVWLGPVSGGLGWLSQRIRDFQPAGRDVHMLHATGEIEVNALRSMCAAGVDRMILSCDSRIDYPSEAIACLQREFPDVPFAVATDNWWDGSRRTGIGAVDHLLLPWYRWWDSWTDWLAGQPAELFGPCISPTTGFARQQTAILTGQPKDRSGKKGPVPFVQSTRRASSSQKVPDTYFPLIAKRGLIVSNCRQLGRGWLLAARAGGSQATAISKQSFNSGPPAVAPQWVLFDDSCLDTAHGPLAEVQLLEFFSNLREMLPTAIGIAALAMPRFDLWQAALEAGARELIAKPNSGRVLSQCLSQLLSLA